MFTQIFFVRHGECEANLTNRFFNEPGSELTEVGQQQAINAGRRLRRYIADIGIKEIYCSPYLRAQETCKLALKWAGLMTREFQIDYRLRERDFEGLSGKFVNWDGSYDLAQNAISTEDYREIWTYDSPKSREFGIETMAELRERTENFLKDISGRVSFDQSVIIFSHGGLGRMMQALCHGWPEGGSFEELCFLKNGEVVKWRYEQ